VSRRRIFQVLLFLALGMILVMATSPADHSAATGINDKVGHVMAFILLGLLSQQAYPSKCSDWVLYAWLLAYGLGIEAIQYFIPERSFSLLDLVADAAGLLIAFTFMLSIKQAVRAP